MVPIEFWQMMAPKNKPPKSIEDPKNEDGQNNQNEVKDKDDFKNTSAKIKITPRQSHK